MNKSVHNAIGELCSEFKPLVFGDDSFTTYFITGILQYQLTQ